MESERYLERDLEEMREYYKSGKTKEATWRKSQLKGLLFLLKEREEDIFKALKEDLGKHHVEAFRDEIGTLTKSIKFAFNGLEEWMSSKKAKLPAIALLSSAELVPEPLGLVLIISSWNFPFGLSLEPLIGAIAAGNTMVLKPSELTPTCSSLLAKTIRTYLDNKAIKVIEGGSAVGEQLLQQKWDKIFFTGSARVGRMVMSAAVKHLTPVTLELGGKCPAVVDSLSSSWDKQAAVNRIIGAKFGACAGQACITIDYILVEKKFASTLVELMKAKIKNMLGENPKETNSMARIVNKEHFLRLKHLLSDPMVQNSIAHGGFTDEKNLAFLFRLDKFSGQPTMCGFSLLFLIQDKKGEDILSAKSPLSSGKRRFIEPTILVDPPLEAEIMTEEIFGSLLPIITMKNIDESIDFINSRPKPLAIYAFTKNETLKRRILSETSSGSVVFNDAIIQYAADTLPFGGIGGSGLGKYHGKFSFDAFSHYKGVTRRSFLTDFWFRFPPWNTYKLLLLETAYNSDYFGMLLVILGLKKSR